MVGAQQIPSSASSSSSSSSSSSPSSSAVKCSTVCGVGGNDSEICTNPTSSAKNQMEQLNTMREVLFSQVGWGCQHVNQDNNWDLPGSPEQPGIKKGDNSGVVGNVAGGGGRTVRKPLINNGTYLWEANLRNGGQPPPQLVQKMPFHIPSTNLGGTWGEEDDGRGDSANVWTGASSSASVQASSSTGNHELRTPRELRTPSGGSGDPRDMRVVDPREQVRGDIRGISGRLNGSSAAEMWGHHGGQMTMNKMDGAGAGPTCSGGAQWGTKLLNFDDGTSLWGQQSRGGIQTGTHWNNMSDIGRNPGTGPVSGGLSNPQFGQTRLGSGVSGGSPSGPIKPDVSMWGNTVSDGGNRRSSWDTTNWGDNKNQSQNIGGGVNQVWSDSGLNKLNHGGFPMAKPQHQQQQNQHQQAQQQAQQQQQHRTSFTPRFGPPQSILFEPQQQQNGVGVGGDSNVNSSLAAMQALQAQKYLNRGAHNLGSGISVREGNCDERSQPSTAQIRMLVQQLQMAVSAGYVNHQILNQPFSPATLVLLNQLLTHIRQHSHLQQLQTASANMNRADVNSLQLSVAITKIKQQITNLQNQIAAKQAVYVKQQQAANLGGDCLRSASNQHDSINSLQGPFADMTMNRDQEQQGAFQRSPSQHSRLNQWKLPALDKDGAGDNADFLYTSGTTAKSTSNSTMGSLGLQGDGTWSSGRNVADGWPDSTKDYENKVSPASDVFTDLVLEFTPGKPWRGLEINQSIKDDPSITPGSVSRIPLSDCLATSSKTSSTDLSPLSLSSSTWSFNPTESSAQQNFTSNSWSDDVSNPTATALDVWGAPMIKTARGQPPGLGSTTGSDGVTNWGSAGSTSSWLLLKNLTAQIDGSILRVLCMQHGPLHQFHLYLNQCIALCKYSSHEEAKKAQMALNNCVLGNTTICSESPSEIEVQNILPHLGGGGGNDTSWQPATSARSTPSDT